MMQHSLFPDPEALKSKIISRRKDFDALFEGFTKLRAVSYVVSPDLLLEFLDKRGFESLEVVVGENLADAYRQDLAQKGAEATERLAELLQKGTLRLLVPDRTLHTKLYLLDRPGQSRVIATSANLTLTAREASRQVNYAWYADLPAGHAWLSKVEADYKAHAERCAVFLGDLVELFEKDRQTPRKELVEAWLKGACVEEVDVETRRLIQDISSRSIALDGGSAEPVFSVKLPETTAARRHAERFLAPLNALTSGGEARLNGKGFLRYVQESHGVPVMRVDAAKGELRLGLDGEVRVVSEPLPEDKAVDAALAHLESYFETVDHGQAPDHRFAKVSMFEALLYLFSAPFANEYMRVKRSRYGAIDSRGPRFLYIYGPSQNGKSTFLRLALKLIAGKSFEPLNGGDFAKRKILGAASLGTCFPLVFDDLVLAQRYGLFEEVLKSYWEVWWKEDMVSPQIILSSNAYTLRDWAKSRVKRLDFDVHFAPGGQGKEALAAIFKTENPVFRWFSGLYLESLQQPGPLAEDELEPARRVFETLYARAGRALPDYFPAAPIETLYDPGRRAWRDLLDRLRKAKVEWDSDRASVHFSEDLQHYEIKEYESLLPAGVKHRRRGKALVIETPKEFRAWLEGGERESRSWLSRLLRR
ncbi:MAG: phospholipase D family protein [Elusimicrobia bacterium]|nr:phospholipase D family protein [Elusimicrobiota bacterium]